MIKKFVAYMQQASYLKYETKYKLIKHILITMFALLCLILLILFIASMFYFHRITSHASAMSDNELKKKAIHFAGDEAIDHKNNNILQAYDQSQNTLIVGPKRVNSNVIAALTSSEDTLFYQHNGILPKALIRAMIQDVFNVKQSSGGSTITQQLIKNQVLSSEKTYRRKANELVLSLRLEKILTKDEIVYTYLNVVPFGRDYNGSNITGIASASYSLFGIPPSKLNIAESAYLIGLLQSPYTYTPYDEDGSIKNNNQFNIGIQRQHYVLKRMRVENKISVKDYHKALNFDIKHHLLQRDKQGAS